MLAVSEKREPRASGHLAFHVLEAMLGIQESSELTDFREVLSTTKRPDPMPEGDGGPL